MSLKLSIIIPCYNCETTLKEAVDSCYQQGFQEDEFEIVMVDDGSTSTTWKLIQTLKSEHKNIRTFQHTENRGGGAARNTAVTHANADIIFCLDSDDILLPHTLKKMFVYLVDKNADGVTFNYSTKFRGENRHDIAYRLTLPNHSEAPVPLRSLLSQNTHSPVVINFMYTKKGWQKAGGYPEHHGFDTQGFGWRFLTTGLTVYTCPDTDYLHRIEYHESYYLREYRGGKYNINWRFILAENKEIFSQNAKEIIEHFDYRDFTKDIFAELRMLPDVFATNTTITKQVIPQLTPIKPVLPNSLLGIFFRARNRARLYIHFINKKIQSILRHAKSACIVPFIIKDQYGQYTKIHKQLIAQYEKNNDTYNYESLLMPAWEQFRLHIEKRFLKEPGFRFLRDPIIKSTMFFAHTSEGHRYEKEYVAGVYGTTYAKQLLRENMTGSPIVSDFEYKTSGNSIHLLYHLAFFQQTACYDITKSNTVVEYGGGYGCLAKIFRRLNSSGTYIIFDIPIFSYLQALYLKTILGEENVILLDSDTPIQKHKINIVPLDLNTINKRAQEIGPVDLFVSTWALSESNAATHALIKALNYFGAEHILLAHQHNNDNFPFASNISDLTTSYSTIHHEEIAYLPQNRYLFARRKHMKA